MIDKLSLTIPVVPNIEYLESNGQIREDTKRSHEYKYLCKLDKAVVLYYPHKFSESTNARISFTKIDLNPKNFECYSEMETYILRMFMNPSLKAQDFNISRLDIAADVEGFSIDCILSMLRISRIRSDSLSFYRGTIYVGFNPKIRIYDKVKEIKKRQRNDIEITDYEKGLVDSGDIHTRFEVEIKRIRKSLEEIKNDPIVFATYFDRLELFDFGDNDGNGVLQVLYKYINRKFRAELEKYRNYKLVEEIKNKYITGVTGWFDSLVEPF